MTKSLTQLEFTESDHTTAEQIARRLWRNEDNWSYTSTSDLIGLQVNKRNSDDKGFTIIKTFEFGFMVVSTMEDINLYEFMNK